jgi:hypothetical protein
VCVVQIISTVCTRDYHVWIVDYAGSFRPCPLRVGAQNGWRLWFKMQTVRQRLFEAENVDSPVSRACNTGQRQTFLHIPAGVKLVHSGFNRTFAFTKSAIEQYSAETKSYSSRRLLKKPQQGA